MKKFYLTLLIATSMVASSCEKGEIGPKGEQGEKGATGVQGSKGDAGATGPQGPAGETVYVGTSGIMGPKGDTGATGATGAKGADGATASTFTYLNTSFSSTAPKLTAAIENTTWIKLESTLYFTPTNYPTVNEKGIVLIYLRDPQNAEGVWKLQALRDLLFDASGKRTTDNNDERISVDYESFAARNYVKLVATANGFKSQSVVEQILKGVTVDVKIVLVPEKTAVDIRSGRINAKDFVAVSHRLNLH